MHVIFVTWLINFGYFECSLSVSLLTIFHTEKGTSVKISFAFTVAFLKKCFYCGYRLSLQDVEFSTLPFFGTAGGKRGVRYYAVSTNDEGGVLFAVHLFLQGVGVGGVCGRGSMQ